MLYLGLCYGGVLGLLESLNHNILNALGIAVWAPRAVRHPDGVSIVPECIGSNSRCLVLLHSASSTLEPLQPEVQKILTGMLSVLALPKQAVMQTNINTVTPDLKAISAIITQWHPQYILRLDLETHLPEFNLAVPCVRTYSPQYLQRYPQYKPRAYKSLLYLRDKINGTS